MSVVEITNQPGPAVAPGRHPIADPLQPPGLGAMAGRSAIMQHLFTRMRTTAPHFRLATVEGEAGAGKMLAAQTLHRIGRAPRGPFAPCTAAEFLERPAEIWQAVRGGLLYLARVDELTAQQQARLRDFLDRAAQERLRTQQASGPLQLVAGAAQPLRKAAASGAFRSDLADSLSAIRFALPPLRDRREDIPLLAELFLRRWSAEHAKPLRGFAPEAIERLTAHVWPGNVRELEMAVCAAALETRSQWIRPIDLPRLEWRREMPPRADASAQDDPNLERAIHRHVTGVLARVQGNKLRAARLLGISRSTLYRMLNGSAPAVNDALTPDESQHAHPGRN